MASLYLVSYDITDPRRLARLHRALKKQALPVQYSVFLGLFTQAQLCRCEASIRSIIDMRTDDVRIYPLPSGGQTRRLGRATLPAGIELTLLPLAFRTSPDDSDPRAVELDEAVEASPTTATDVHARRLRAHGQTGQRKGLQFIR